MPHIAIHVCLYIHNQQLYNQLIPGVCAMPIIYVGIPCIPQVPKQGVGENAPASFINCPQGFTLLNTQLPSLLYICSQLYQTAPQRILCFYLHNYVHSYQLFSYTIFVYLQLTTSVLSFFAYIYIAILVSLPYILQLCSYIARIRS